MALPYNDIKSGKKQQVQRMFDSIAARYDFLNHLLSFGIDKRWRRKTIKLFKQDHPKVIIDIACGTGDFSFDAMKLGPEKIIGIDISNEMLEVGKKKIKQHDLTKKVNFEQGDAENIDLESETADLVISAFGVRNFENLDKGLSEMNRILKKGGKIAILEFSTSNNIFTKTLFKVYFNHILPFVGKIISKDRRAYTYLPESVGEFPSGKEFLDIMKKTGFRNNIVKKYTFGICSAYIGMK